MELATKQSLFGGKLPWNAAEWTAQDDTVRGGSSKSFLDISPDAKSARFYGTLDATSLGAGFASQRTTAEGRLWDLSAYDGIDITIAKSDEKTYSFNIKDTLSDGGENDRSSVSWEYAFTLANVSTVSDGSRTTGSDLKILRIPWNQFKAFYRGREKPDEPPLALNEIKRYSIMCRSFFLEQNGPFELEILGVAAVKFAAAKKVPDLAARELEKGWRPENRNVKRAMVMKQGQKVKMAVFALPILLIGLLLFGWYWPEAVMRTKVSGATVIENIRGWLRS